MKISELVEELEQLRKCHGDIPVQCACDFLALDGVWFREPEPVYCDGEVEL